MINEHQCELPKSAIRCIAIVGFDLNEGQVISHLHPANSVSESFLKNLASIAFPDTLSFSSEGELFYFVDLQNEGERLYCYIAFNQKKDKSNERGYHQSSTVIISPIKAVTMMKAMLAKLNSIYNLSNFNKELLTEFFSDLALHNEPLPVLLDKENYLIRFFGGQLSVGFNRDEQSPTRLPSNSIAQKSISGVLDEGLVISD